VVRGVGFALKLCVNSVRKPGHADQKGKRQAYKIDPNRDLRRRFLLGRVPKAEWISPAVTRLIEARAADLRAADGPPGAHPDSCWAAICVRLR